MNDLAEGSLGVQMNSDVELLKRTKELLHMAQSQLGEEFRSLSGFPQITSKVILDLTKAIDIYERLKEDYT